MLLKYSSLIATVVALVAQNGWGFDQYRAHQQNATTSAETGRNFDSRGRHTYWARDGYSDQASVAAATSIAGGAIGGGHGGDGGGGGGGYASSGGGHGGGVSADTYAAAAMNTLSTSYGAPMAMHAAPSSSYGVPQQAEPLKYYYQVMPNNDMAGSGSGWGMEDEDDDDSSMSAILGLLGVKGIKKAKGLKALKAFKFLGLPALFPILLPLLLPVLLPLLLPILLPLLLPLLLLALLPLLFIPIPVIMPTTARGGREAAQALNATSTSIQRAFLDHGPIVAKSIAEEYGRALKNFAASSECVERISCELGRVARTYRAEGVPKTLVTKATGFDKEIGARVERATKMGTKCQRYKCSLFI